MDPENIADLSVKRCLWCLKPIENRPNRKYCSQKCRKAAYRWRLKGSPAPVFGQATPSGMTGEDAARYLVELKGVVARMAALRGRGDAMGDACAAAATVIEDELKELGL